MFDQIVSVPYLENNSPRYQRPKSQQPAPARPSFFRSWSTQSAVYNGSNSRSEQSSTSSTPNSSSASLLKAADRPELRASNSTPHLKPENK